MKHSAKKHLARNMMSNEEKKAHTAPFLSKNWQQRKESRYMAEDARMNREKKTV